MLSVPPKKQKKKERKIWHRGLSAQKRREKKEGKKGKVNKKSKKIYFPYEFSFSITLF